MPIWPIEEPASSILANCHISTNCAVAIGNRIPVDISGTSWRRRREGKMAKISSLHCLHSLVRRQTSDSPGGVKSNRQLAIARPAYQSNKNHQGGADNPSKMHLLTYNSSYTNISLSVSHLPAGRPRALSGSSLGRKGAGRPPSCWLPSGLVGVVLSRWALGRTFGQTTPLGSPE